MDGGVLRSLSDKTYDKRKVAALEVEKQVRESIANKDHGRIVQTIGTLTELLHKSNNLNSRCGALMGLAAIAVALGYAAIPKYLNLVVSPIIDAFADSNSQVRYFASESMYNVAKVARGEILIYFNELFDILSKMCADPDISIKNGSELLDRLIKDIVTDQAATYVSALTPPAHEGDQAARSDVDDDNDNYRLAFSLQRFMPLLEERMSVLNVQTRMYLVKWLGILDSIPELELVTYLPNFLEGLLNFLRDPTIELRTATFNILAEFLKELREIAEVQAERESEFQRKQEKRAKKAQNAEAAAELPDERAAVDSLLSPKSATAGDGSPMGNPLSPSPGADSQAQESSSEEYSSDDDADDDGTGLGEWMPGQGVVVKHGEIIAILIRQLKNSEVDQSVQAVCLRWLNEFLHFSEATILSSVPSLVPLVMTALSHPISSLRQLAESLNDNLYEVISSLPSPPLGPKSPARPEPELPQPSSQATASPVPEKPANRVPALIERVSRAPTPATPVEPAEPATAEEREPDDPFDFQATVTALATLLGVEDEESRLAALQWLAMLHLKAPTKILLLDDGTFPALLKTLSDTSEDVIRSDLQLLAQISYLSDEEYFNNFMANLLKLFSTDRPLLEQRGRLIVGQLCTSLNTERIFRTFAKILEDDEDLEFASLMVQNLNLFLVTLPELGDFRRRLRNLDAKDSQSLFTALYRSWSHNAAAALALCFLCGAYEHASNMLPAFADLDMTVGLLIQIDKLVQLLESTAFTPLRLQLLEPDRYPYLQKALYGVLMLLPQSTAYVTLRNRLNAVAPLLNMHPSPRTGAGANMSHSARSTFRRADDIKWQDLLSHFRSVQVRHERARRTTLASSTAPAFAFDVDASSSTTSNGLQPAGASAMSKPPASTTTTAPPQSRPQMRRAFGTPQMSSTSGSHLQQQQQQQRVSSARGGSRLANTASAGASQAQAQGQTAAGRASSPPGAGPSMGRRVSHAGVPRKS